MDIFTADRLNDFFKLGLNEEQVEKITDQEVAEHLAAYIHDCNMEHKVDESLSEIRKMFPQNYIMAMEYYIQRKFKKG